MKKYQKILFYVICAFLFLLSCFRWPEMGTDTQSYIEIFKRGYHTDIGFSFLAAIVSFFTSNYTIFFICTSILIYLPIFGSIRRYSYKPLITLIFFFLYYYFTSINILRQFISIAIIYYWAIPFVINRVRNKFFIVVVIAGLFHFTAILFAPVYYLVNKELSIKTYFLIWIGSVTLLVIDPMVYLSNISSVMEFIASFDANQKVNVYYSNIERIFIEKSYNRLILFNLFLLFFYYRYRKHFEKGGTFLMFFNIYFIGIVFRNVFHKFLALPRIAYYFEFALIFLLANEFKKKNNFWVKAFLIIISLLLAYLRFIVNNENGIFSLWRGSVEES